MKRASPSFPLLAVALAAVATVALAAPVGPYYQTNLVSNLPGVALNQDPDLQNPWGISSSSGSPFWVSDNGTGVSTLYNSFGVKQGLVVTMPVGAQTPTGQAFAAPTTDFGGDVFFFASEDGGIAGWRGGLGTNAELVDSVVGGVLKGLASSQIAGHTYLYSADFAHNAIHVTKDPSAPGLAGTFTDPNLPNTYAPFNIQNLNGTLYVTYAIPNGIDDVPGPGHGIVSAFDLNGNFLRRVATGGDLNSPWGLALAPSNFGPLSGTLLVGNFGDGKINAFDPNGAGLIGTLADIHGNPIANDGLWGLKFGNGGNGGDKNRLYLTAGLNDEADGLFARIQVVPEPGTVLLFLCGGCMLAVARRVSALRSRR
jgi:uncharacterized protein (TIGR03118 family)